MACTIGLGFARADFADCYVAFVQDESVQNVADNPEGSHLLIRPAPRGHVQLGLGRDSIRYRQIDDQHLRLGPPDREVALDE